MTLSDAHRALHQQLLDYWLARVQNPAALRTSFGTAPAHALAFATQCEALRQGLNEEKWGEVDAPDPIEDLYANGPRTADAWLADAQRTPPGSGERLLCTARAVGRGAPLGELLRAMNEHGIALEDEDAASATQHALAVDSGIARFGGDAESRCRQLAEAWQRGAVAERMLQQIARAADTEGVPQLALEAIEAAQQLADARGASAEQRVSLLNTLALVQISFFDLAGCAATSQAIEALQPGGAALVEAYRRTLARPFDARHAEFEPDADAERFEPTQLLPGFDRTVATLASLRHTLRARLGDRCPIPALDALRAAGAEREEDLDELEESTPDLLLQAQRHWTALCLWLGALGEPGLTRPHESKPARFRVDEWAAQRQNLQKLLQVLVEAGTLGELDEEQRATLAQVRWGKDGVSLLELPSGLAESWLRETEQTLEVLRQLQRARRRNQTHATLGLLPSLPLPAVLSLAEGIAQYPQIEHLELHDGLRADTVVIYDGDVEVASGALDDLLPTTVRECGGAVVVIEGSLHLGGQGGWTVPWDRDANALLVRGDLHAKVFELTGVIEVDVTGDVEADAIYVHHGDDGGYLNVGGDLRADAMLATTYFNVSVSGDVEVERLVVDSTYAGDFAEDYSPVVSDLDDDELWPRLLAGEHIEGAPDEPTTKEVSLQDTVLPEGSPAQNATFGPGQALKPLPALGWPLHIARIGDELVMAGNLGTSGNVVRSVDGERFRALLEEGTPGLRQVHGHDPDHLFAVGEYGTVLRLDSTEQGVTVTTLPAPSSGCLFGVWEVPEGLLVSGDDGIFLWQDDAWHEQLDTSGLCRIYPSDQGLLAIGDADDDGPQVWLRGADGWTRLPLPGAKFDAYSLSADGDVAVVCGSGGAIWRLSLSGAFTASAASVPKTKADWYGLGRVGERLFAYGDGALGVSSDGGVSFAVEKTKGNFWGGAVLKDGRHVRGGRSTLVRDDGPFLQPSR